METKFKYKANRGVKVLMVLLLAVAMMLPAFRSAQAAQGPELTLTGEAGDAIGQPIGRLYAGDTIFFTLTMQNTGSEVIYNPATLLESFGFTGDPSFDPIGISELSPGAIYHVPYRYTVSQDDIDLGGFKDATWTASGKDSVGNTITSNTVDLGFTVAQYNQLTLTQTVDAQTASPGDTLTYSFHVENTGNTSFTDLSILDPLLPEGTAPSTVDSLYPWNSVDFSATYTVPSTTLPDSTLTSTAQATGTMRLLGTPVMSNESSVSVTIASEDNGDGDNGDGGGNDGGDNGDDGDNGDGGGSDNGSGGDNGGGDDGDNDNGASGGDDNGPDGGGTDDNGSGSGGADNGSSDNGTDGTSGGENGHGTSNGGGASNNAGTNGNDRGGSDSRSDANKTTDGSLPKTADSLPWALPVATLLASVLVLLAAYVHTLRQRKASMPAPSDSTQE